MDANERIEKLLNRFGQTISDLPTPADHSYGPAYDTPHHAMAKKEACIFIMDEWKDDEGVMEVEDGEKALLDYICHLADVIDRMETALETAVRCAGCLRCTKYRDNWFGRCNPPANCDFQMQEYVLLDDEVVDE